MQLTLSHPAREMGHQVRAMGVVCVVAHIFERDCNARKGTGKQSYGKGKLSKSWSKSESSNPSKGMSKENKGNSKGTKNANQGAKGVHKGNTSKAGLSGLEKSKQMQAQVWRGMMTGVLWDGMKVGNKRNDTFANSFSLGGVEASATKTLTNVDRVHRDGCDSTTPDERIMTATAVAMQWQKFKAKFYATRFFYELASTKAGDNFQSPIACDDDRESRSLLFELIMSLP